MGPRDLVRNGKKHGDYYAISGSGFGVEALGDSSSHGNIGKGSIGQ